MPCEGCQKKIHTPEDNQKFVVQALQKRLDAFEHLLVQKDQEITSLKTFNKSLQERNDKQYADILALRAQVIELESQDVPDYNRLNIYLDDIENLEEEIDTWEARSNAQAQALFDAHERITELLEFIDNRMPDANA